MLGFLLFDAEVFGLKGNVVFLLLSLLYVIVARRAIVVRDSKYVTVYCVIISVVAWSSIGTYYSLPILMNAPLGLLAIFLPTGLLLNRKLILVAGCMGILEIFMAYYQFGDRESVKYEGGLGINLTLVSLSVFPLILLRIKISNVITMISIGLSLLMATTWASRQNIIYTAVALLRFFSGKKLIMICVGISLASLFFTDLSDQLIVKRFDKAFEFREVQRWSQHVDAFELLLQSYSRLAFGVEYAEYVLQRNNVKPFFESVYLALLFGAGVAGLLIYTVCFCLLLRKAFLANREVFSAMLILAVGGFANELFTSSFFWAVLAWCVIDSRKILID